MKKCIVIGVTGGIAAFKACSLVSTLKKKDFDVHVIMTKNATNFIHPTTFESLSGNRVSIDTFDRNFQYDVHHISLAKKADCFIIVPATANVIAKVVHGLADDMLTTTFLAASCPKIICPAMNVGMLENPITQENLKLCKQLGYMLVDSEDGFLACGDIGNGRLADLDIIEEAIENSLVKDRFLTGKKVLITAGPTVEKIDPVRFITNHSSGKMGYALAKVASSLGAEVTLISGPTQLTRLPWINTIDITSAKEMADAVKSCYQTQDIIIKSAAVADFTPAVAHDQKIKKSNTALTLNLSPTEDILAFLGANKKANQVLCGFAMETENTLANAKKKLESKKCDCIVLNDLTDPQAGFKKDTNKITFITKDSDKVYPVLSKEEVAFEILKQCNQLKGD
ncbi:MAG: bifunctional phosphopantothenoylcysteine decarboxylase/phosphopantothenate--cysteine ligase CoaBC [Anaerorhabdus sp.]